MVVLLHKPATSWVILACSLALTFAAWFLSDRSVHREAEDRFHFRTEDVHASIGRRIAYYEHVLESTVALFQSSESLSRDEFHQYVTTLRLDRTYPGIQGVGFNLRVPSEQLDQHIAAMRRGGLPITTCGRRGSALSITQPSF